MLTWGPILTENHPVGFKKRGRKQEFRAVRIRRTTCKRYAIEYLDKGYKLHELCSKARMPIRRHTLSSVGACKAEAEKCEADRLKVWHYFVEMAKRDKKQYAEIRANPSGHCGANVSDAAERGDWSIEELADHSYSYMKYRAFATTTGLHGYGRYQVDPAMNRDWHAMLEGTYKQWWEKQAG